MQEHRDTRSAEQGRQAGSSLGGMAFPYFLTFRSRLMFRVEKPGE